VLFSVIIYISAILFLPIQDGIDPVPDYDVTKWNDVPENKLLQNSEYLSKGELIGAEDVEFDAEGNIYTGLLNGNVVKITKDKKTHIITKLRRPLSLRFDKKGNLLVLDGFVGLLSLNVTTGESTVLSTDSDGVLFGFADYHVIASDGSVYFTDASSKYNPSNYLNDFFTGTPNGRVLKYDPQTKKTTTLISDLYFANGVALSQDESFLLVAETWKSRIKRYYLKGPKAGTIDMFSEELPGLPDNINSNGKGTIWVGFPAPSKLTDMLFKLAPYPPLKRLIMRLPSIVQPMPAKYGMIAAIDEVSGNVIQTYQDPSGKVVCDISGVREHDGYLYLTTFKSDFIAKYKL